MQKRSQEFGDLLRKGVHHIALRESKSILAVQDDLGYKLGRSGSSAIDFWRKGHIPTNKDVEKLAREIIQRSDLGRDWLERFLFQGKYFSGAKELCDELCPLTSQVALSHVTDEKSQPSLQAEYEFEDELAPFVTGSPITHVRQFWGRERELRKLFSSLSRIPLRNTAIIGLQRSGKTSLLHYLRQITTADPASLRPGQYTDWLQQPGRYRWVFVDFQDVRMTSQEGLLSHILTELQLKVPTPCTLTNFLDMMSTGLRGPAVLLFDEIGVALEQDAFDQSFWWSMRSLVTNLTGGRLSCIVTSQRPPEQVAQDIGKPSPFFNIFYRLDLRPLTEPEARALIASSPQAFAPSDVNWIVTESGCWPALLQILCDIRLSALENGEADNEWQNEGLQQIARLRHLLEGA